MELLQDRTIPKPTRDQTMLPEDLNAINEELQWYLLCWGLVLAELFSLYPIPLDWDINVSSVP